MALFKNKIMYRNKQLYLAYLKEHHGATPPDVPILPDIIDDLIYDYTTVPRVDVMYYNPKQFNNEDVIIPIYMTDWYMREYNLDDNSLDFTLNVEVDGVIITYNNMKAGEHNINLGRLSVGEHWFGLEVIDNQHDISSSVIYQEVMVLDASKPEFYASEIYTVTNNDLITYSITEGLTAQTATEEKMINNKKGLTKLFADLQSQGYKKCILPQNSVFRVNRTDPTWYAYDIEQGRCPIIIPSDFTIDMNNSTFKLHPYNDLEYGQIAHVGNLIVDFFNCHDSHLINGTVEGDYAERQQMGAIGGSNGEPSNGVIMRGGSYNTLENVTITQITGYNFGTGQFGVEDGKVIGNKNWVEGLNVVNGENVEEEGFTSTSDFLMMDDDFIRHGFISAQVWLAFGGIKGHYWTIWFHFYDDNKNYIKTIKGTQYRKTRIPDEARYFKCTFIKATVAEMSNISFVYMKSSMNCGVYNCHWIDNRTCSAPCQYRHFVMKDCNFTRSGQSITPCEIDCEDGWEAGMDYFLINCKILENVGTADLIMNCGHNAYIEGCENFSLEFRYRLLGITVKNCKNGHIGNSLGFMTKHTIRVLNNEFTGLSISNTSADPDFYKKVKVRYKNNKVMFSGESSGSEQLCLDGNEMTINGYYSKLKLNNTNIYYKGGANYCNGDVYYKNCNIYADPSQDYIRYSINTLDVNIEQTGCIYHNNFEITNHNYFNSGIFTDCIFKENVTVTNPSPNIPGDIAFNRCTFEKGLTIKINKANAYVELNNCTFNSEISYDGSYSKSNTIINEEIPYEIIKFRPKFEDGTVYHNIGTCGKVLCRKIPYISTEPYTVTLSNNLSSLNVERMEIDFLEEGECDLIFRSESGYEERLRMYNVNITYSNKRLNENGELDNPITRRYTRHEYIPVERNNCPAQIFVPGHYAEVSIAQYDESYNCIKTDLYLKSVNNDTVNNDNFTTDFTLDENTSYVRLCYATNGYTKLSLIELFARTEIRYL